MNRTSYEKADCFPQSVFSCPLPFITFHILLVYLSNLYSWQPENRVVTRIIATVSRVCKDFSKFWCHR
jgi:hypothetical protein